MTTLLGSTIKKLRTARALSQAQVAETIGVARPSYIAIEKGQRDVSLTEAEKLSRMLGVTVEEIYEYAAPDYGKYQQMILAFLRLATRKGDGKVTKTKLAKYLYLADFAWFYSHLESMSGMAYRRIDYGPVPDQYFRALEELERDGLAAVDQKKRENGPVYLISVTEAGKKRRLDKLAAQEKELLKKIERKWRKKDTAELVAFTHEQMPYALSFDAEIIPYELIIQEDPAYVY